ncbi:RNA 2',3'-cyclic phosphodiesterase [Halomarina ordinaria]|uniref:RNA 2',3'-cyclic phosphodiesterase n=1 Tax=Halomarina ordinaria TaxID=3033939 RepID=A0ABD5UCZ1_9EURY|nr:RNA 2',3'-cyclic phosphodiesterase [Halomarina sp. PSRA2]
MRLFVSVDLDPLADALRDAQQPLADADDLRLTDPEQAHLTLSFLGEVPEARVPSVAAALRDAVAAAGVGPFDVHLGGYGVFPSPAYISVVWVGVREGNERLTRLHEAIESRLADLGFAPEDHEFTPHVTVARMDDAGGKSRVQRIVRERDPDVGRLRVEAVRLTESRLTSSGPVHETVEVVDLRE